ncbi:hypothetical protein JTB14_019783 [Gonioctena quinquepunctata]|nr:hypothetical protein JTB14_019783 [Gonioctena quinquepunctata]
MTSKLPQEEKPIIKEKRNKITGERHGTQKFSKPKLREEKLKPKLKILNSKRNSLRFYGLEEHEDEVVSEIITSFLKNKLNVLGNPSDIDLAFRVGTIANNKIRPILVNSTTSQRAKEEELKGADISIYEDLTKARN